MATGSAAKSEAVEGVSISALLRRFSSHWPLVLGLLIMAVPTCLMLARNTWASDLGAHGPIVLVTGIWLLSRCWNEMSARATAPLPLLLLLLLGAALAIYAFGRAYDFMSLEAFGLYLTSIAMLYHLFGLGGLRVAAFPLVYLAFIVPLPGWVLDYATSPLREFVSYVATNGLRLLNYPIVHQGVAIYIAQYQLLVEDACSGMNSIVGLTAIALFYVYVMGNKGWARAVVLLAMVLPVAILVNLLRVTALILLTYYAGDGVAQGFMHVTTGIVLFGAGLLLMFAIDSLLSVIFGRASAKGTSDA